MLREEWSGYWSLWGCHKAQGREVIEKGYELNQLFLVVLRESSVGQSWCLGAQQPVRDCFLASWGNSWIPEVLELINLSWIELVRAGYTTGHLLSYIGGCGQDTTEPSQRESTAPCSHGQRRREKGWCLWKREEALFAVRTWSAYLHFCRAEGTGGL